MREAREAAQGTLRQTCKTASLAVTTAAERQRAVRSQTQPAEDWQISGHRLRRSPHLGEFDPRGQIPPQRLFSFGPCTARFLFSAQPKRENGGALHQPSSWLKSPPPVRARKGRPCPKGVISRPAPVGRNPSSPARGRTSPPRPHGSEPPVFRTFSINCNSYYRKES